MLHHDKELFEQIILRTAEDTGINVAIIEKDYYVTLFLKEIVDKEIYKADYTAITEALLFEKVDYSKAIIAVQRIIESGILD